MYGTMNGFGSSCGGGMYGKVNGFGSPSVYFGRQSNGMEFGKKRGSKSKKTCKMSKKQAMSAFKKFFMKYCKRGSRFGNGGNPPLYQSMGGEFCPSGMGGVLGAFGTGLNPTPCTPFSQAQATAEANAAASVQQLVAAQTASAKFGARRRRCTRKKARAGKCTPKRKSRKA
jgi:hypothetical protein